MGAAIAIFFALFVAIFVPLILSGKQWTAAEDKARARRMAEHRMNARLLRVSSRRVPCLHPILCSVGVFACVLSHRPQLRRSRTTRSLCGSSTGLAGESKNSIIER